MAGGLARRPTKAHIRGEQAVLAELRSITRRPGTRKAMAQDSGVSLSRICQVMQGKKPISIPLAEQAGFTLAWVRMEELDLLAKLERELARPSTTKEGE